MLFYKDLYSSEKLAEKKDKIIWKLQHNAGMVGIYVITLSTNGKDLFDICHSAVLMQSFYHETDLYVVGIANGKREAMGLVQTIVEDIYQKTGSYENMRAFLEDKECYR